MPYSGQQYEAEPRTGSDSVFAESTSPEVQPMTIAHPPPPFASGWSGAATAVHAIRQFPRAILVSLTPIGHGPMVIDFRDHTYLWNTPIEQFPLDPERVDMVTQALGAEAPPLARHALPVDPLLWMIGLHSFAGGRASWLRAGEKYRLKRWPDFGTLPHTPEQATLVKTLARGLMTVEKLAKLAGTEVVAAQRVVNALSLMSALRRIESPSGAPMLPPVPPEFEPADGRGRHRARRGG
jgi:hypothetical protein